MMFQCMEHLLVGVLKLIDDMKAIITINNDADYIKALNRMLVIFDAPKGTPESNEADLLIELIEEYENKKFQ